MALQTGLGSVYHIGIKVGCGIWPQLYTKSIYTCVYVYTCTYLAFLAFAALRQGLTRPGSGT